jgi:hypothetical protein
MSALVHSPRFWLARVMSGLGDRKGQELREMTRDPDLLKVDVDTIAMVIRLRGYPRRQACTAKKREIAIRSVRTLDPAVLAPSGRRLSLSSLKANFQFPTARQFFLAQRDLVFPH